MSFLTIAKILNVKSPVQKKIIEILHPLQGYSKKLSLLEDQLAKELPGQNNYRSIKSNLAKMQELGLAYTKEGSSGTRFVLDKQIWCYKPPLYELLKHYALKLYDESRSDIKFEGLLKKYKHQASSKNEKLKKLPHKFWKVILTNFLKNEDLFNSENKLKEISKPVEVSDDKDTNEEFRSTPKIFKSKQEVKQEIESLIIYDDIFPLNLKNTLEPVLIKTFPTLNYISNIIRIRISLALGRSQQVFITIRQSESFSRIIWIYTLCGDLSKTKTPLLELLKLNNDANPIKVAAKTFNETEFLICAVPIKYKENWEDQIKELILKVASYGDRIESEFWHEDYY